MRKRNARRNPSYNAASRNIESLPWSYFVVIALCGCVLAAGFFLAARQHFTSMDFGIKNSRLREHLKALEAENRRLLLAKEVSLSPEEIKKTARNLGFREVDIVGLPVQIALVQTPRNVTLKAAVKNLPRGNQQIPEVKLTASQKPVKAFFPEPVQKNDPPAKNAKKTDGARIRKDRIILNAVAKLR